MNIILKLQGELHICTSVQLSGLSIYLKLDSLHTPIPWIETDDLSSAAADRGPEYWDGLP